MIILEVNKVNKNFGYGTLFENLSFSLNEGESISIVGPNGCGKSTLLKMIIGLTKIDGASINIKKGAKVAYLDQTGSSIEDERSVYEILKDAFVELNTIQNKINNLQEKLNSQLEEKEYNNTLIKYCDLLDKFSNLGGYDISKNINTVVDGLNINRKLLEQCYNNLSGGEKTIVQLAKALLSKPDLFLLDEPTNHLDIQRIEWLEAYIKSFKGATVIVSHDRYFLDKMSNKILAIDNGKAKVYNTNYSGYLIEREKEFEKQLSEYKTQQIKIKRLETQIKYFAEMGIAKNSSTLCDRARALQSQLDRLKKSAVPRPKEQKKLNMKFDSLRKTSKEIISCKKLSVILPNGKAILNEINLNICAGERIALIGANGSGKSTFIKTIMNRQNLQVIGEIKVGPNVKIGYIPQIINFSNENLSLLEYFKSQISINEQIARQILAEFQFYSDDVNKSVKNLSGGEKIRIKLAELLQRPINTLIFDEPTNHIDINTKEVLEEALINFKGTLIFVSHDRYFINKLADKVIEFKDATINTYLGGYDDYKRQKKSENII